jgi:hypothetical protein
MSDRNIAYRLGKSEVVPEKGANLPERDMPEIFFLIICVHYSIDTIFLLNLSK